MLPTETRCPTSAQWEGLVLGRISNHSAEELVAHLQSCSQCEGLVSTLPQDDPLIKTLQSGEGSLENARQEAVDFLIQQLKGIQSASLSTAHGGDSVSGESNPSESCDFLSPPQEEDEIGRLGSYRVLRILGRGGMGMVFQAEDIHLKRLVALKVMLPHLARSAVARQRFLREAQMTAALSHDHVVAIFQVGEENNVPFLAMPLLLGESLESFLEQCDRLPLSEAIRIARETAEGLAAAHDHGLIHRDIKPSNLWLEAERRRVKILDFGLARTEEGDAHITQAGTILGTPAYMSPEQAEGNADVDQRADLFSLGCLLYRLTTGEVPFTGTNAMAVMRKVLHEEPIPVRERSPRIPQPLANLIHKLLAKAADRRPSSAHLVVKSLQALEKALRNKSREVAGRAPSAGKAPPAIPNSTTETQQNPNPAQKPTSSTKKQTPAPRKRTAPRAPAKQAKPLPAPDSKVHPDASPSGRRRSHRLVVAASLILLAGGALIASIFIPDSNTNPTVVKPPKEISPPPITVKSGEPLSPSSLVQRPAKLPGVISWDIIPVSHRGEHQTPRYSPDGSQIVTCDDNNVLRIWDSQTGNLVQAMVTSGPGCCSSRPFWSPDGKHVLCPISGAEEKIYVWNVAQGALERAFAGDATGSVTVMAWSGDGKYLATGQSDGKVYFWDMPAGKKRFMLHKKGVVRNVAWSHSGEHFAIGTDNNVSVHSVKDGKLSLSSVKELSDASLMALSPTGTVMVIHRAGQKSTVVWDYLQEKVIRTLDPTPDSRIALGPVRWLHSGKQLACYCGTWEMATGKCTWATPSKIGETAISASYEWSPDGKYFFAHTPQPVSHQWQFTCINRESNRMVYSLMKLGPSNYHNHHKHVAWSPKGNVVACSLASGDPGKLFDAGTGTFRQLRAPWPGATVSSVFWSSDGESLLSSAHPYGTGILEFGTNETYTVGAMGSYVVQTVGPKGKYCAAEDAQGNVILWQPKARWKKLSQWKAHDQQCVLSMAPRGDLMATMRRYGHVLKIWEVPSGKLVHELKDTQVGNKCCWSADGKRVASGDQIWDVATGKPLVKLKDAQVLAWSANGKEIVGWKKPSDQLGFWDAKTGKLLRTAAAGFSSRGRQPSFSPDLKYAVSEVPSTTAIVTETKTGQPTAVIFSFGDERAMVISPEGHYRADVGPIEEEIRYVVQTNKGQQTLTPAQFAKKYKWKNDPRRVSLIAR